LEQSTIFTKKFSHKEAPLLGRILDRTITFLIRNETINECVSVQWNTEPKIKSRLTLQKSANHDVTIAETDLQCWVTDSSVSTTNTTAPLTCEVGKYAVIFLRIDTNS